MYRDNRATYNEKARETVTTSQQDIPSGFTMPKTLDESPPTTAADDDAFWVESDAEDNFDASASSDGEDAEMDEDEDGEEQESEEDQEEGPEE